MSPDDARTISRARWACPCGCLNAGGFLDCPHCGGTYRAATIEAKRTLVRLLVDELPESDLERADELLRGLLGQGAAG